MGWLEGKIALITGGGAGLGLALTRRFVKEGARILVMERDAERAAKVKDELGDKVEIHVGDVTSYADNEAAVAKAVESFGQLDCFVANARSRQAECIPISRGSRRPIRTTRASR